MTVLFSVSYAGDCSIKLGQSEFDAPWLMWVADAFFVLLSILSLRTSVRMYILNLLMFTIVYMVIGVMGYGWYLPEICALFMVLGVAAGFSAGYSAERSAGRSWSVIFRRTNRKLSRSGCSLLNWQKNHFRFLRKK